MPNHTLIGRLKFLAKDTSIYGITSVLYSLIQFLTLPVILHSLSKTEVADWNILLVFGAITSSVIVFGMDSAVVRYYFDSTDASYRKQLFSTGLLYEILVSILVIGVLFLLTPIISKSLSLSNDSIQVYWIFLIWLPIKLFNGYFQNWLKYTFQQWSFIKLTVLISSVYLLCIFYLKFFHNLTLLNVGISMLFAQSTGFLLGCQLLKNNFTVNINFTKIITLLNYGIPFMFLSFGTNFLLTSDRFFLVNYVSEDAFASYSVAQRIIAVMTMIISAFTFAFNPFILSTYKEKSAKFTVATIQSIYLMLMCGIGLIIICYQQWLITLLAGEGYLEAQKVFPILILSYIIYGLYSFAQIGIVVSKKSQLNLIPLAFSIIFILVFNFFLVEKYLEYAVCIGFLVGVSILVLGTYFFSLKEYYIQFFIKRDLFIILLFVILAFFFTRFSSTAISFIYSSYKVLLLLPILITCYYLLLLENEKEKLKNILNNSNW